MLENAGEGGRGQGLLVDLAIGRHGHLVDLGHHLRHHVLGQIAAQVMEYGMRGHLPIGAVIGGQRLGVLLLDDNSRRKRDRLEGRHPALYLAQLDPVAVEFHLIVGASEILQFAVLVPHRHVAGMIHGLAGEERAGGEMAGRLLSLPPIAARHLAANETQLARNAPRHEMAHVVDDDRNAVRDWASDGYPGVAFRLIDNVIGRADRELRRAVAIDQRHGGLAQLVHLLATHDHIAQGKFLTVNHLHSQLRAHRHTDDMLLGEVAAHALHVVTQVGRQDVDGRATRQGREQVEQGGVETEAGMLGTTLASLQLFERHQPLHQGAQPLMFHHHALGTACGA